MSIDDLLTVDFEKEGIPKRERASAAPVPELHSLIVEKELALREKERLLQDVLDVIERLTGLEEMQANRDAWAHIVEKMERELKGLE